MSDVNAVVETPDKKMKEGDHFSPDGKWEPQFVSLASHSGQKSTVIPLFFEGIEEPVGNRL